MILTIAIITMQINLYTHIYIPIYMSQLVQCIIWNMFPVTRNDQDLETLLLLHVYSHLPSSIPVWLEASWNEGNSEKIIGYANTTIPSGFLCTMAETSTNSGWKWRPTNGRWIQGAERASLAWRKLGATGGYWCCCALTGACPRCPSPVAMIVDVF